MLTAKDIDRQAPTGTDIQHQWQTQTDLIRQSQKATLIDTGCCYLSFVGCLTFQQHASVSQGRRIRSDNRVIHRAAQHVYISAVSCMAVLSTRPARKSTWVRIIIQHADWLRSLLAGASSSRQRSMWVTLLHLQPRSDRASLSNVLCHPQCTDLEQTSLSADRTTPSGWQGSHRCAFVNLFLTITGKFAVMIETLLNAFG